MTERPELHSLATLRVMVDRALWRSSGDDCVEWAVSMLLEDRGGRFMRRLAGMTAPYHHFEMADLRDRALEEAGIGVSPREAVVSAYLAARLEAVLSPGGDALGPVLDEAAHFYRVLDFDSALHDLYALSCARDDLRTETISFNWPDATRATIDRIVREKAIEFVLLHRFAAG